VTAVLDDRAVTALGWLIGLPLLGAYELAMILGEDERATTSLLSDLLHDGWLDAGVASSPELEPDRLYGLSPAGRSEVARALALTPAGLGQELPVDSLETAYRWARVETTVGLNRFLAELVVAVQRTTNVQVEAIRSLPRRRSRSAWWPAEVEAYGCLRANHSLAPFFVAWDRATAPFDHRQKRLSAWYSFNKDQQAWGNDVPPILVLCANASTSAQWAKAAQASAKRHADQPLEILLAEIDAAFSADPLDEIWRSPETDLEAALTERLTWRERVPDECHLRPPAYLPQKPSQQVPMRSVLTATETSSERPAPTLFRQIGVMEKRFLDWLAFHPLLTADDLSVLVHCRRQQAQTVLTRLKDAALIEGVVTRASFDDCDGTYYFLSTEGLKTLARRDGVPARRYARYGPIAAAVTGWQGEGRLQTLLRQFEHTVGTNRFCIRLLAESARRQIQVIAWLSAADSTMSVSADDGHRLRPDAAVDLQWRGVRLRVLVEWDRNTMRGPQMNRKLAHYAAYFRTRKEQAPWPGREVLLVVTTTPFRESDIRTRLLAAATSLQPEDIPLLTSTASLVESVGPFGSAWSCGAAGRSGLIESLDGLVGREQISNGAIGR
jgi:Replication-relaxation